MERTGTEWNNGPVVNNAFLYRGNGETKWEWKADRTKTVLVKRIHAEPIYFNVELLHDAVWEDL